jgi:hypothetical protein
MERARDIYNLALSDLIKEEKAGNMAAKSRLDIEIWRCTEEAYKGNMKPAHDLGLAYRETGCFEDAVRFLTIAASERNAEAAHSLVECQQYLLLNTASSGGRES